VCEQKLASAEGKRASARAKQVAAEVDVVVAGVDRVVAPCDVEARRHELTVPNVDVGVTDLELRGGNPDVEVADRDGEVCEPALDAVGLAPHSGGMKRLLRRVNLRFADFTLHVVGAPPPGADG
jgi:hypothetical protein